MALDETRQIFSIEDIRKAIGETPPQWRPGDDGTLADEWRAWSAKQALLDTLTGKLRNRDLEKIDQERWRPKPIADLDKLR